MDHWRYLRRRLARRERLGEEVEVRKKRTRSFCFASEVTVSGRCTGIPNVLEDVVKEF
jgi:hypothetical protein